MKPFARADRISKKIQSSLSELLRKKINDPRLEMVTITGVELTRDLRDAYIYFAISSGEKAQKEAERGFHKATGFIRSSLAKKLGLRYMPKLRFVYDKSFDYGSHMNSLLKSLQDDEL